MTALDSIEGALKQAPLSNVSLATENAPVPFSRAYSRTTSVFHFSQQSTRGRLMPNAATHHPALLQNRSCAQGFTPLSRNMLRPHLCTRKTEDSMTVIREKVVATAI